jgi:two-component system cell cycle response regulator
LLKAFGHHTFTAHDGEQGLATARRELPDLIVCDIQLPVMDGHAVARQVKSDVELKSIPIVAVTALAMVGDRDKVLASGFDGYISKPINPESFVAQVEAFSSSSSRSTRTVPAATAPPAIPAQSKQVTILAVDDNSTNLNLGRSILEPLGYSVVTARGIIDGLELARTEKPDLIVSDVAMLDGSGFDFIREVKKHSELNSIPFIFVTSTYYNETSRMKGIALGAADFLFRPFEPQVLLSAIEACLAERKKQQRDKEPKDGKDTCCG